MGGLHAAARKTCSLWGKTVTIVSAADDAFAELDFSLHRSLGPWAPAFRLIDIGLSEDARREAERRGIDLLALPDEFFRDAKLLGPYLQAMYLRPRLPQLVDSELILWIDSDCWIQRIEAITQFLDGAIEQPSAFTICTLLDIDYPRCIDGYIHYQFDYRRVHIQLFGEADADKLYGNAIFSSGIFAADRASPVWDDWWRDVRILYETNENVRTIPGTAHIAEQQALNRILHWRRAYNCLSAEMNWNCHCSDVVREGSVVKIKRSGRIPAVVHLSMFREREAEYREKRLLYEPPGNARPEE